MAKRKADGKHPATIKREAGALKAAMRWAEGCDPPLRTAADWRKVKLPKVGKRRPHHHDRKQLVHLLRRLPVGQWRTAGWLGARAGLRRAEILHLHPRDLDFERRVVRIVGKACRRCPECRQDGGRWEPKDVDEREVPMFPDLERYLRGLMPGLGGQGWVMASDDGGTVSLAELSTYFARLTRKAHLKGGVQTLRHTFGCHMADDGVRLRTLQAWMGHENIETTMMYVSATDDSADVKRVRPLAV